MFHLRTWNAAVQFYLMPVGIHGLISYFYLLQYDASPAPTVTCAVYSGNGDAIVASYNDDDIYLFDTMQSEAADAVHKYSGHRNNATGVLINCRSK